MIDGTEEETQKPPKNGKIRADRSKPFAARRRSFLHILKDEPDASTASAARRAGLSRASADRIRKALGLGEGETPPATRERKPTGRKPPAPAKRRVSLGSGLSEAVSAVGGWLVVTGKDPGVGQALMLESRIAGQRLDAAMAHTFLDRLIQPIVRKADNAKGLGVVLGLPAIVAISERAPALAPRLRPYGQMMLVELLMELKRSPRPEVEKIHEADEIAKEWGAESGLDIDLESLTSALFGPPTGPLPRQPEAEGQGADQTQPAA